MGKQSEKAKSQLPWWLRAFDDKYGVTWRGYNAIRRINLRRGMRFAKAWLEGPRYQSPIFVIGVPRSGTSLLFRMLSLHPDLAAMPHEGHDIWRHFHHPRKTGWDSDVIDAKRAHPSRERRYAEAFIRARSPDKPQAVRFIEKTPDNALRIQYILKIFPDAQFVVIHRDPCAVINSFINGWRDPGGRFRAYFVPETLNIPDYGFDRRWCFTLIPGWRDLVNSTVPVIAFRQWSEYVRAIASARDTVPDSKYSEIFLEDIQHHPEQVLDHLANKLELNMSSELKARMAELARININSFADTSDVGSADKNRREISELLPEISTLAPLIGFDVNSATGEVFRAKSRLSSAYD
ncbi:sulfotransferase [Marinobacter sp. TBZ242]|uniref:Sulfotransferase n=1 Tax=Marinobacter azerbaijanicus TaxID=3050455 RepID=A0ABT7I7W2_9GAMM|nr:sulfotransferase [Marinobacter sp. TBZ242]MDL0429765.1 sulfotransferase [Marinobacter sp. TBZ242]